MTKTGTKLFYFFTLVCVVLNYTPVVIPQTTTTGAVEGHVYLADAPEKGVGGATILVTSEESGLERSVTTDTSGNYFFGTLPPGHYTITVTAPGYESRAIINFAVKLSKTNVVIPPIALKVATVMTTQPAVTPPSRPKPIIIATESGAEQLTNTSNATRGENFDRQMLVTLPLPGVRSFDDLAFLAPGVAPPPQAIGNSVGPGVGAGVGTSGQFSVNGQRSRSNNFTVDGSDNNDEDIGVRRQGFTSLTPQSIESLQEFQITTLLPEPQFGRYMGAQVNAVSRSGGKDYHGNLYFFFTDDALKARDFFDLSGGPASFGLTRSNGPIFVNGQPFVARNPVGGENPFNREQYGFVVGGPLFSQKSFFFTSFEHQRIDASRESNFAVPTIRQRGFFDTGETGGVARNNAGEIVAPVFPTNRFGDAFFSLFPFPNNPRGPFGPNTFTDTLSADADGSIFSIRLDQQSIQALGMNHTLTGRYNITDDNTILPVTGEALFSSLDAKVKTQNVSIFLNSNVSSRISNQLRLSYGRTSLQFTEVRDKFLSPSTLLPNVPFLLNAPVLFNATLPTINPDMMSVTLNPTSFQTGSTTTEDFTGPLGQVEVSGFSPIGVDVFNFPQQRNNNTYQYADTILYNLGKQIITGGFDIRQLRLNSLLDRNFRPVAVFGGSAIRFSGGPQPDITRGSTLVAAGAPTGFFQSLSLDPDSHIGLRYWENSFFLADQIRLRHNFTLTVGLRYEINTVPTDTHDRIEDTFTSDEVMRFEQLEREATGVSGLEQLLGGRTKIFSQDKNNVAPHIALAWDVFGDGKTSVRAGYGIYYDQFPGAIISQSRNVFPTFLTVNTAGFQTTANGAMDAPFLVPLNPASALAVPGTLNRLDSEFASIFGSTADFLQLVNSLGTGGGLAFVLPASDLVTPYSQHWGITVEQQIKRDFLLSVAYVGTKGTHLLRTATPNLGPNASPALQRLFSFLNDDQAFQFEPLAQGQLLPPGIARQGGRPFPLLGSVTTFESDANSIYHALQLQATKRFTHGVQFTTAYTWSHAIDEVSDLFNMAGATALPQDSFDRRAERGNANFDVRHRFVYSIIWDLPFFQQNKIFGGWQVANIGTFQSGQPYTIIAGFDVNLDGNLTDRLNNPAAIVEHHDGPQRFEVVPTVDPFAPLGRNGAVGRNTFRAQGIATVDLALNKHFRFKEHHDIEFRSEFFNLFDRANFGIPVHQIGSPFTESNGTTTSVGGFPGAGRSFDLRVPPRTIQFALKYSF